MVPAFRDHLKYDTDRDDYSRKRGDDYSRKRGAVEDSGSESETSRSEHHVKKLISASKNKMGGRKAAPATKKAPAPPKKGPAAVNKGGRKKKNEVAEVELPVSNNRRKIPTNKSPPPQKAVLDRSRSRTKSGQSSSSLTSSSASTLTIDIKRHVKDDFGDDVAFDDHNNDHNEEDDGGQDGQFDGKDGQDDGQDGHNDVHQSDDDDEETVDFVPTHREFKKAFDKLCPDEEQRNRVYTLMSNLHELDVNAIKIDFEAMTTWNREQIHVEFVKNQAQSLFNNTNIRIKLAKKEKELEVVQAQLDAASVVGAKTYDKMDKTDAMMGLIKHKVKQFLWLTTKFLVTDAQIFAAANTIYDLLLKDGKVGKSDDDRRVWMKTYARAVNYYLIKRRDYFFTRCKDVAQLYHDKNNNVWLTKEQILACATREIGDMEVFKFYWIHILSLVTEGKTWENEKFYHLISTMVHEGIPGGKTKLFSSSHEAMIVLAFDNNEERWPLQHKIKAAGGREEDHPEFKASRNGKYTKQDLGQKKTGWCDEGLIAFNNYLKLVKDARKKPHYLKLEKEAYAIMRAERNIVCADGRTQKKLNKRRKMGGDTDQFEAKVNKTSEIATIDESSDVEEEG